MARKTTFQGHTISKGEEYRMDSVDRYDCRARHTVVPTTIAVSVNMMVVKLVRSSPECVCPCNYTISFEEFVNGLHNNSSNYWWWRCWDAEV